MSSEPILTHSASGRWQVVWRLIAAALLVYHGALTLRQFGPSWGLQLLTADPVVSGHWARHLQQAEMGAEALRRRGGGVVFDPTFQAGYPKSPWFDAESPAFEWFILCGGRHNSAEACKIGAAVVWWMTPIAAAFAAWLLGLGGAGATLSMGLAVAFSWSEIGRERFLAGDFTTILASVLLLIWASALVRLADASNPALWLLAVGALTGLIWLQPLLLLIVMPAGLAYHSHVGWRRSLAWQAWFFSAFAIALVATFGRFRDALATAWLLTERAPALGLPAPTPAWDWLSQLQQIDFGQTTFVLLLLTTGLAGMALLRHEGPRSAIRGWWVLLVVLNLLAFVGPVWSLVERFEPLKLLIPGLLLATPPAAHALLRGAAGLRRIFWRGSPALRTLVFGALASGALALGLVVHIAVQQGWSSAELEIGLSETRAVTAQRLRDQTTATARILWEDSVESETWSPLLPRLTGRSLIGGLAGRQSLDCFWLRLEDGQLAGRPIGEWSADAWQAFCRQYNIGWVVVRCPQLRQRLTSLGGIQTAAPLPDGSTLLTLDRPHTFVLRGEGSLEVKDGRVSLRDLVPEDGEVVLSLHYLHGLKTTLARVAVEPLPQRDDPLPLVRLKLTSPIAHVTLFGPE